MNTPSAQADSFSDKLCRNRLAWRPKARSVPKSPLMNYLSGRNISVHDAPTLTDVHTFLESLRLDNPTLWASLRCAARIDHQNIPTGAYSLVGCQLDEKTPRCVIYGACQHSSGHGRHVEFLESDKSIIRHNRFRDIVHPISALSRHLSASTRDAGTRLSSTLGTDNTSGESPLSATLSCLRLSSEARSIDDLPVTSGDNRLEAKVDTYGPVYYWSMELGGNCKDDIPFALLSRNDSALDATIGGERSVPNNLYSSANPDDGYPTISHVHAITKHEFSGMKSGRGSEPRVAVPASKKRQICLIKPVQNALKRSERPSPKSIWISGATRFDLIGLLIVAQRYLLPPSRYPLFQCSIVECTKVTHHSAQRDGLDAGRAKAVLVGSGAGDYRHNGSLAGHAVWIKSAPRSCKDPARSSFVGCVSNHSKGRAMAARAN